MARAWFRPLTKLPRLARKDSFVLSSSFVITLVMRLVSTIVLTRLLTPEAFGAMGIIMSLTYVVQMVSDVGFADFVIRHKDGDDPRFLDVIWTIRLIRSVILTIVLFALSGPICALIGKPELKTLCEAFSFYFVIEGATSLSLFTALRHKAVARYNLVDLIVNGLQIVITIGFAALLRTYWAFLIGLVVGDLIRAVLSYVLFANSRRRIRFDRSYAAEQFRFARYVTGSSIMTLVLSQSDKLVLSRLFPLDTLGLYVMAANLASVPILFSNSYSAQLLYPRYAGVWRDAPETLPKAYYQAQMPLSFLYMLGAGGLIAGAPVVVEILYDDRYRGAALFLSMLGLAALLSLNNAAATNASVAMGRFATKLKVNFIRLGWIAATVPISWWAWGPVGVIGAYATVEIPALIYQWAVLRSAGVLSLRREAMLLATGGAGIALGYAATLIILPLLRP